MKRPNEYLHIMWLIELEPKVETDGVVSCTHMNINRHQ